jgi:hypothetical protein
MPIPDSSGNAAFPGSCALIALRRYTNECAPTFAGYGNDHVVHKAAVTAGDAKDFSITNRPTFSVFALDVFHALLFFRFLTSCRRSRRGSKGKCSVTLVFKGWPDGFATNRWVSGAW